MSLTSEMSRITADFEAAQGARLATIAKIGSRMRRENHGNKASLMRKMAAHRAATKSSLRDIFGTAAFARGAAEELIERFREEREESANDLRDKLSSYAAGLRETVAEALSDMAATRAKMARRDEGARRTQLKDLRRRVHALLANSEKLISDFHQDRERAGRIWEQHLRNASRQRRASSRAAAEDVTPPRKRATRKIAKKRKQARA
jgi:hypothetical protein